MVLCDGDAEGKRLASVYGLKPKELPAAGHLRLTKDEARRIAGALGGGGDTQQLLLRRCWGKRLTERLTCKTPLRQFASYSSGLSNKFMSSDSMVNSLVAELTIHADCVSAVPPGTHENLVEARALQMLPPAG